MLSFPTPLSPITRTEISVLETPKLFSKARFSPRLLPIIPKRCLTNCNESILNSI